MGDESLHDAAVIFLHPSPAAKPLLPVPIRQCGKPIVELTPLIIIFFYYVLRFIVIVLGMDG